MDGTAVLTGLLAGAALGGLAGWLLGRARGQAAAAATEAALAADRARADTVASAERARADQVAADRDRTLAELGGVRATLATSQQTCSAAEARLESERQQSAEKLAAIERTVAQAETKLREAFQSLSADALRGNNQAFLTLARETLEKFQQGARGDLEARQKAIDEMLRPVKESLGKVDTTLASIETTRAEAYGSLGQHLTSLGKAQAELQSETRRLVTALRAPQVRGAWGEMQLRRVVEMAGMLDHCDFHEQVSVDAAEGGKLRPDLVVRLPGGKNVVVDAKAPLAAYLDALEAQDEGVRRQRLADHARQVRDHMTRLASKAYWDQLGATPEFVVMFLPGEAFFSTALQEDPALIELGVAQRVLPASPVTLIALLRSVAYGWSQERIAENAREISELGRDLHDRLSKLGEHFERLGRSLTTAVSAYNDAVGSIEARVFVTARKFRELGVSSAIEIAAPGPVERTVRETQSPELDARSGGGHDENEMVDPARSPGA